jgi:hypothetical protein
MEGGVHHVSVSEHLLHPWKDFPAAVLEQLSELTVGIHLPFYHAADAETRETTQAS